MKNLFNFEQLKNQLLPSVRSFLFIIVLLFNALGIVAVHASTFEAGNLSKNENAFETDSLLAFPEADGWGRYTSGGRGGAVIYVTNLNDSGEGSLREAVLASGARTVLFKVSGTIELNSTLQIKNDSITIAGQSAPGDGITIKGSPTRIDANNVIVRYLRFRMGDFTEDDAFKGNEKKNIMIDHCTMSWGVDEAASFYRNEFFTMQNCIISESLFRSLHVKGDHGYGGIWGGNKASFIRNLIAHHTSRTPRFNGARYSPFMDDKTDFRNNVIYNWGFNNVYGGEPHENTGTKANINIVNNYYKPGPATNTGPISYRVLEPSAQGKYGYSLFYVNGNEVYGKPEILEDNWELGVQSVTENAKEQLRVDVPFDHQIFETLTASEAYDFVLSNAGVRIPKLDIHETRVIKETREGNAAYGGQYKGAKTGIIDTPGDVGGWPFLFSATAPVDSDSDGMPDEWEIGVGLDPNDPSDRNGDLYGEGYTNLEYYLNSIEAGSYFVIPPTQLVAELTHVVEITVRWIDNSETEDGYYIERMTNGNFEVIDTLAANTSVYIDKNVADHTEYTYRVVAFEKNEKSVYSNTGTVTSYSETAVPMPVILLYPDNNAIKISNNTLLSWSPSLGAESYNLYFGEEQSPALLVNLSENNYRPTFLPNKTYYWRVEAVNKNGKTNEDNSRSFSIREQLEPQMVGHWTLDVFSDLTDSSPFESKTLSIGIKEDATVNDSPVNQAIVFNGSSQYIYVPHSYQFDFDTNSFTLAFWLKSNTISMYSNKILPYIFKGYLDGDPNAHFFRKHWEMYSDPLSDQFVFKLDDGQNSSSIVTPIEPFFTMEWVHVVATRDVENHKITLYANGQLIAEETDNTGDLSQDRNLYFAYRPDDKTYLRGSLDDIRLYNYALSQAEIDDFLNVNGLSEQMTGNSQLRLFPNPANHKFSIQLPERLNNDATINIINTQGQKLMSYVLKSGSYTAQIELEAKDLAQGTYIVQLLSDQKLYTSKLMIVR